MFSAATFVCYSWSLLGFFNRLSSFILHFTFAEIAEIFAFMMAFTLLESLALTIGLVLLSGILPTAWLRNGFTYKGFVVILLAAAASIVFQKFLTPEFPSPILLLSTCILPLLLMGGAISLLQSHPRLQGFVANIQDRISIMLFIFVPIGLLSLVLVVMNYLL